MRDLELIREKDDSDGSMRRTAMVALATAATAGLVLALVLVVRDAAEPAPTAAADDPLAALARTASAKKSAPSTKSAEEPVPAKDPGVERTSLTFPEALARDERPEVHAALAAAAAEYEHLDPVDGQARTTRAPVERDRTVLSQVLPAAVTAGPDGNQLARAAVDDPMVAAALPSPAPKTARAPEGKDGRFTLQIISYRTRTEADLMAEALRGKGHAAFVVVGEIENRGTFYRVRVGPFENMAAAQSYRSKFESSEGMNTFVVKQRDLPAAP